MHHANPSSENIVTVSPVKIEPMPTEETTALSEVEVRQIIDLYNKSLDQCTRKNEDLIAEIHSLQSKLR